ncbi:MAG: hypothetical protein J5I47_10960 [Vicingus serpentipes]|nr:hypothetical protein [Vicingus serpentipes]
MFKRFITSLILLSLTTIGYSQLTLNSTESGYQWHCDATYVYLQAGYSYSPAGTERMHINTSSCTSFKYFVVNAVGITDVSTYSIDFGSGASVFNTGNSDFQAPSISSGTTKDIEIELDNTTTSVVSTVKFKLDEDHNILSSSLLIDDGSNIYEYNVDYYFEYTPQGLLIVNLNKIYNDVVSNTNCIFSYKWVAKRYYNENGVIINEGMTFLDDIGRPTQNQIRNFITGDIMTSQNIYDAFGRSSISTMSAPTYTGAFCYQSNFITANSGQTYDYTKFDLANTSSQYSGEKDNPYTVDNTTKGTLGWYFSNNNNEEPFVATTGIPYSRLEYYNDPLGRSKKTAGIGDNYKMGSGHETQLFYGEAGFEFESVYNSYGNGQSNIISKTITKDADGVEKIVYTDGLGNVRATCYSGMDNDCMDMPIKHELTYHSTRSVDIHLPDITGQELKWYWNKDRNCRLKSYVEISVYDLIGEKELVSGTDYVLTSEEIFDFSGGSYADKTLYLRISYNYDEDYIGEAGAYYTGIVPGVGSFQANGGNYFPSQSFGYKLDYGNWTLNYYDEKGNLTKTIHPEGVDCNGMDPDIGYLSETGWKLYDVYDDGTSSYPIDPADVYSYNSYSKTTSSIFEDEETQSHKIKLELKLSQYQPESDELDPCAENPDAGPGTETYPADAISMINTLLEELTKKEDYESFSTIMSDSIEDEDRLEDKIDQLEDELDQLEDRSTDNLAQQTVVNNDSIVQDSLSNTTSTLYFDGIDDLVDVTPSIIDTIEDGDFTFEATIRADEDSVGSDPIIFCNNTVDTTGAIFFFKDTTGTTSLYKMLAVQLEGVEYYLENNGALDTTILDSTCHHVAITREDTMLSFYVDGFLLGTKVISGSPDITTGSTLRIGLSKTNSNPFKGNISDVRVWNIARTDDQISNYINAYLLSSTPYLIANCEMNEASGQNVLEIVSDENALLGTTGSIESSDPTWVNNACRNVIELTKLKNEKTILIEEYQDLQTIITNHEDYIEDIEAEGYYPVEPKNDNSFVLVDTDGNVVLDNGGIISEASTNTPPDPCDIPWGDDGHCSNGIMDCDETGVDVGGSCLLTPDPCYGVDPKLVATFNFNIEILIDNGSGGKGYVNPDGSVTTIPYTYAVYPKLYKTCECEYLWDQTSLAGLPDIIIDNEELNNYPGGIEINIKSIWVAQSPGYFLPFNASYPTHQFAKYLRFFTYMTHTTAPLPNDNISHGMEDTYEYDALDQRVKETTPDKGSTEFVYDSRGRIRFQQNAQQQQDEIFSYVNYDRAGREVETGVYDYSQSAALQFQNYQEEPALGGGEVSVLSMLDDEDGIDDARCSEQIYTLYDVADVSSSSHYPFNTSPYTTYEQTYLLGRVSKVWNDNSITWYSYDMYGRVIWTIEYLVDMDEYKTMHYEYDAAGNVSKTIYQKDDAEYFEHQNTYNGEQQLIKVETSEDGTNYDVQANYEYYQHGALKRTVLGDDLQGVDYVYTVTGKLKAINSPNLGIATGNGVFSDPGADSPTNNGVFADVFGMVIDYHVDDYKRTGTYINYGEGTNEKFTSTINQVRWNLEAPSISTNLTSYGLQNVYQYEYNDFNWLASATFGTYEPFGNQNESEVVGSDWEGFVADANSQFEVSGITYDKNGNITALDRNGNTTTGVGMDEFTYNYTTTTQSEDGDVVKVNNQLTYVTDGVSSSSYTSDIETQSAANYTYNAIGELTADASENKTYTYYQSGLAKEVLLNGNLFLKFKYNPAGKRIKKEIYNGTGGTTPIQEIYYVQDLSGQVVSIYDKDVVGSTTVTEYNLYGLNQLGSYDPSTSASRYHLYDHLGNVRATFRENTGALQVISAGDYYPFGGILPGRSLTSSVNLLTYGYQGKELDQNGLYDFEARLWDARLGRWITTDPASQFYSPYLAMGNNPISSIDPDGEFVVTALIVGAAIGAYIGGTTANGSFNPLNWNFHSKKTWGFMIAGAVVGGLSGGASSAIASAGGPFANTMAIIAGSTIQSIGTSAYTGNHNFSVSFGVGSYNFTQNDWGYLLEKGNSGFENFVYGMGAAANFSDVLTGLNKLKAANRNANNYSEEELKNIYDKATDTKLNKVLNKEKGSAQYAGNSPKNISPEEFLFYKQKGILDGLGDNFGGFNHDLAYFNKGADGIKGVLFNTNVTPADYSLIKGMTSIIQSGASQQVLNSARLIRTSFMITTTIKTLYPYTYKRW